MRISIAFGLAMAGCLLVGCSKQTGEGSTAIADKPAVSGARYILPTEPAGAVGVMELRESAQDKQPVVVLGRVGIGADPWVAGRAAFVLVDASVEVACEESCEEGCTCHEDEIKDAITLIKFVDEQGRTLDVDSRDLLGIADGQLVAVRGVVKKSEASELTVMADGIYVRR